MSLRARIAAVAGVAVAVAVLGSAAVVYWAVGAQLRGEVDRSLRQRASALAAFGPGPAPGDERPPGPPGDPRREPPPGAARFGDERFHRFRRHERDEAERFGGAAGIVRFVGPDGGIDRPPDGGASFPLDRRARRIAARGTGEDLAEVSVGRTPLRVLTLGAGRRGAVQVARPLDEVKRVRERLLAILATVGVAGVALAAALGALVARTALGPIDRFTRRTEALAGDPDPSQRMEVAGGDELARLARSFNATLDALERSVEAQRHLVADASHELRTPIASLRTNIQVLEQADRLPAHELESLRTDILEELDELTALVSDVVELARGAEAERSVDEVRLDLVVRAVCERAARRAGDRVSSRPGSNPAW